MIRKFQGKDYLSLEDVRLYYDAKTKSVVLDVRDPYIPGGLTLVVPPMSENELKLLRVLYNAGLDSGDYGRDEPKKQLAAETETMPAPVQYRNIILGTLKNGQPLRMKVQTASGNNEDRNSDMKSNVFIVEPRQTERSNLFSVILSQVVSRPWDFRATVYAPNRPDLEPYRLMDNVRFLQNEFELLMFLRASYEIPLGRGSIVNLLLIDEFNALINPVRTPRHINERTSSTLRTEILSHIEALEKLSEKLGFYCVLASIEVTDDYLKYIETAGTRLIMTRLDRNSTHPLSEKLDIYMDWPDQEGSQTGYVFQNGTEGFFFTLPLQENGEEPLD